MNQTYKATLSPYALPPNLPTWGDLEVCSLKAMMFEKYPSISPYTYCKNNPIIMIDEKGLFPKPILRRNQDGTYSFKPAAAHLLSLVSQVPIIYIQTVKIQERKPGQYRPIYNIKDVGGGAITLGTNSYEANITFTENYFEDNPSTPSPSFLKGFVRD